jgi:hypothetical protein
MAFINLPGIIYWGNAYSQQACPSTVFLRLVQRNFPVKSRFLWRPRLLTRSVPLPTGRDIPSLHKLHSASADTPPLSLEAERSVARV